MPTSLCSRIKRSLSEYLADQVTASASRDYCVVTVPIKTVDDRWVSVIVEERLQDQFRVHDAGKTDSELFGQGIKMTEPDLATQAAIAAKYGVTVGDRMIQTLCQASGLNEAIMAVAQSAAVMTAQLVWPAIEIEEQQIERRVAKALTLWKPDYIDIEQDVSLRGAAQPHKVNFVSRAHAPAKRNAAVNILLASTHHMDKARNYGYLWLDLKEREPRYHDWGRLAVIPRVETWSKGALDLIKHYATDTLEMTKDQEGVIDKSIPEKMSELVNAESLPRLTLL